MTDHAIALSDGRRMPRLGFGLWQVRDAAGVTREALRLGYRLADGAALYGNEEGLGEGVRRSGLPRDEVWVTTKVWNDRHDDAGAALDESLARLGMDHVDLALIHWPCPRQDRFVVAWEALIRAREAGKALSIGVSNFREPDLDRLVAETGVVPVVNQVELHPDLPQAALRARHAALGIATQGWTPLGQGRRFADPAVRDAARRTGATPAQVVLAWQLALGSAPIPRSEDPGRLAENLGAAAVALRPEEVEAIGAGASGRRTGPDPSTLG